MELYRYGAEAAPLVLIQPVDDHDLSGIETEAEEISRRTSADFRLTAVKIRDWNQDLSPWKAPAVFGKDDFGDGAAATLRKILELCADKEKTYILGGYSLAGLFALWAAYQTDIFAGIAAASPSVWFPGFADAMRERRIQSAAVYLSLGDREERTKHPVMATVGDCIRNGYSVLKGQGVNCCLEWNPGNHFKEPELRTAKAFSWVIGELRKAALRA